MTYEVVIGLEVHAQLATESKLFSNAPTRFGAAPNHQVSEVCLGLPGTLPVLNARAVELAATAGLALECTVHRASEWSRKHYFYADLPKGYQITQYHRPIATAGRFEWPDGAVRITRIHMEEDAGKSIHDDVGAGRRSLVDYNRAGVPLIEIVTEPDFRSGAQAASFLRELRLLLLYLGVCDGNMEEGSLRCDANVSLRPAGSTTLGTRAEIKNLNSFRFVQAAIEYEALRQEELLREGGAVVQETRLWDTKKNVTRTMRSKEDAHDYRYCPDPDLPLLVLADGLLETLKASLPEPPLARRARYRDAFALSAEDAATLVATPSLAQYFERVLEHHHNPKATANWILNELLGALGESASEIPVPPAALAELIALIDDGTVSGKIAKEVLAHMLREGGSPRAIVQAKGLLQVSDTSVIEAAVSDVLASNPEQVSDYRAGKTKVMGFFVGQVMKATAGKANPKLVQELLARKLS